MQQWPQGHMQRCAQGEKAAGCTRGGGAGRGGKGRRRKKKKKKATYLCLVLGDLLSFFQLAFLVWFYR
jgi:hypothetical protein